MSSSYIVFTCFLPEICTYVISVVSYFGELSMLRYYSLVKIEVIVLY